MGTFSGPQAKGAKAKARQSRREQAERRNGISLSKNRRVNRLRAKRPKQEKPQPAECPWPWKVPYPSLEAAETALAERQLVHGGDWLTAVAYDDCPAGHAHIGHPTAYDRTGDSPADSEAA